MKFLITFSSSVRTMVITYFWFRTLVLFYVGVVILAQLDNEDIEVVIDELLGSSGDPTFKSSTPKRGYTGTGPGPNGPCICVQSHQCKTESSSEEDSNQRLCEDSHKVCCAKNNIRKMCGYRHIESSDFRLQMKDKAQFGEFPWMTAVLREEESMGKKLHVYHCGGALIHPQVVVTAAHCVNNTDIDYIIRVGEWDTTSSQEQLPHQNMDVRKIIAHPQFDYNSFYNNIALLILKNPVKISEHVDVICLPAQDEVIETGRCLSTGWGKNLFGQKGKYQEILKKVDLPIVRSSECQEKLRRTRLGNFFELHKSFICAGGELGKDTCKGDGGSPLVCPILGTQDRYFQAGIVAWGLKCGEQDVPAVYVNVALFRDWIDDQLKLHNFDSSSYHQ